MPWLLKTHNSDERLSDSQPNRAVFSNGLLKFSQAKSQLIRSEQRGGSEGITLRLTAVFLPWKKQWSDVGGALALEKKNNKKNDTKRWKGWCEVFCDHPSVMIWKNPNQNRQMFW